MSYNPEYSKNSNMLKKCRKMHTIICFAYFITCIPFAFISLYSMTLLLIGGNDTFSLFWDVIFKTATFILGYLGSYCHKSVYSCYAAGAGILDIIVCGADNFLQEFLFMFDGLNVILLVAYIILCIMTFRINKNYNFLEQQEGFPYFSERFEEQKAMKGIDIYAERYETIKKASSGKSDMDEL